jgi:hypothetical protein
VKRIISIAVIFVAGVVAARAQSDSANDPAVVAVARAPVPQASPASDLVFEDLTSYGNYRIFAGGSNTKLYTSGVEYDRHSWGRWLGARRDYAGEFLPVMMLNEPAKTDIWGDTLGHGRKYLYGMGISPAGMRLEWRDGRGIKPYFSVKGGVLAFDGKVLSKAGTYMQFSLQEAAGLIVKVSPQYDVRLGLFGDYHFSNGFMTNVNPGLDVMNFNVGLVYHLGSRRTSAARAAAEDAPRGQE